MSLEMPFSARKISMAGPLSIGPRDALIVVDVQRDFCPGGALAVPDGDRVDPVLNRWLAVPGIMKLATRDWHPPTHCSFRRNGGPWPEHCVQGTAGAELHPDLDAAAFDGIVNKGTDPSREAYSGFDAPELLQRLRQRGIERIWVGGLATEYCVRATVLDGLRHGFRVLVIADAIRGIELKAGDCERAIEEMRHAGAEIVATRDVAGVAA